MAHTHTNTNISRARTRTHRWMYIHIHIHIYTYTYVYIHIRIFLFLSRCMYTSVECVELCYKRDFILQKRPKETIFCCRFNLRNCDSKNTHVWHMYGMGWLRWVGSLKLKVYFAEYSLFYRALLHKRPTILRSLLIAASPYVCVGHDSLQVGKMEGGTDDVVSFAKESYKRDYILQKRPAILRSLLIVATPYRSHCDTLQHNDTHCNTL